MLKYKYGLCYGIYVMKIFNKKFAFTLAEVLITIGIVGTLAALTIPTLNNRVGDQENIARFRAMYSRLSSALDTVQVEKIYKCYNVTINDTLRKEYFTRIPANLELRPTFDGCYTENRDENDNSIILGIEGLIPDMMKLMGGTRWVNFDEISGEDGFNDTELGKYRTAVIQAGVNPARIYILKDGTFFIVKGRPTFTNIIFIPEAYSFYIDTNGAKKPNMLGKDIFYMSFYLSDANIRERSDGMTYVTPRQIDIYPYNLLAGDDDPQIKLFKKAIGAEK